MQIRYIEDGSALKVWQEPCSPERGQAFEAVFYKLDTPTSFWAQSEELYKSLSVPAAAKRLRMNFHCDNVTYEFLGEAKAGRVDGDDYLTLIEQISPVEVLRLRSYNREEMKLAVNVYGLDPDSLHSGSPRKASVESVFSCQAFDISAGGVCLVSDERFSSPHEPYFLLEFTLGRKDYFLLPARLVRKGDCPQTTMYRYDYGFDFIFSHLPEEQHRLSIAIFTAKLER